jgi:flagellar protein FlbD
VILVHRLRGEPLYLNADLIESVEATPDTVVTLVDGRKAVVTESPEVVVDRVRTYRASLLVAADEVRTRRPASLTVLPGRED